MRDGVDELIEALEWRRRDDRGPGCLSEADLEGQAGARGAPREERERKRPEHPPDPGWPAARATHHALQTGAVK